METFYNVDRARRAMRREGLDALIAQSPESVQYQVGSPGFFNEMLRNGSAAAAVDFVDPNRPPALIVSAFEVEPMKGAVAVDDVRSYPTWIASDDIRDILTGSPPERPVQPDPRALFHLLAEVFADRGITTGRVGIEARTMPPHGQRLLEDALPGVTLVPADDVFSEIRAVKSAEEVAILRQAALITESAVDRTITAGVCGATQPELCLRFQQAVIDEALLDPLAGVTRGVPINFSFGTDPFPVVGYPHLVARPGDVVKLDSVVRIRGYSSDIGRTYSLGNPAPLPARLATALLDGLDAALNMLRPGQPLRKVFGRAVDVVREAGFPRYSRGHIGHAIGLAMREDAPFIAPHDTTVAEVGMTFAVELPYYVQGLGAMLFEENVVVTEDGVELLTLRRAEFAVVS